ncbi:hypothetical protein BDO18943_01929 [Burkholderia dolosa]|nr:hypothetical protein BDO18943_01929 [Burkholderia dolosa]
MPRVSGDRRRPVRRLCRDGRGEQPRRRRNGRTARARGVRAGRCALQGLHDRRSAHADEPRVQRDAQDARGAAAARQVHPCDDRSAENPRHRAVALPAVQSEADAGRAHRVASRADPRRRADRVRAAGAASARARRAGQHARCVVAHRPGDRVFGERGDGVGGVGHARRARPDLYGAPARRARRRQRPGDPRDRRRDVAAQPVVLHRIAGSRQPAAPDRVGAVRTRFGARRMAGSGRPASLRGYAEPRTGAVVLSDCNGRAGGTRARTGRICGFHDDAAADARVRACRRGRRRGGRSAFGAACRAGAPCGCRIGCAVDCSGEAGLRCACRAGARAGRRARRSPDVRTVRRRNGPVFRGAGRRAGIRVRVRRADAGNPAGRTQSGAAAEGERRTASGDG